MSWLLYTTLPWPGGGGQDADISWDEDFLFFRYIPKCENVGSCASSTFSLLRNFHTVYPSWLHYFTSPPTTYEVSLFSASPLTLANKTNTCLFVHSLSIVYEGRSHCGLDVHFPGVSNVEHLVVIWIPSLEKCLFGSYDNLNGLFLFFFFFLAIELYEFFMYFGYQSLIK